MAKSKAQSAAAPKPKPRDSSTLRFLYSLVVLLIAIGVALGWGWPMISSLPRARVESTSQAPVHREQPSAESQPQKKQEEKSQVEVEGERMDASGEQQVSVTPVESNKEVGRVDKSPQCKRWAESGECDKNPDFMRLSCQASCPHLKPKEEENQKPIVSVNWEAPVFTPELQQAQAETDKQGATKMVQSSRCVDARTDCELLARWNLSGCGEAPFMLTECSKTCRTCQYSKLISGVVECSDEHKECASWARAGECEANRRFMLNHCSVSCGVCEQKKVGCARRDTTPGIPTPTGMSEMFEHALTDSDIVSKHATKALSTDPYILQFENMVSPEEARDIIARCGENDRFERSMAGDQLSPVRTSTQCWCDDSTGCLKHPTIERVTERLMNITGMPVNNAEYFQILKYEKDQFYKVHHDQQTAHWTPQGVRVFTFFVYLSDVAAGGGTRFTDLKLEIQPKLGRAVLWPSVQGHDLLTGDMRTHHEALPVIDGIKYAANLWIHLYDFKSPSRAGLCPFLGQNTNG